MCVMADSIMHTYIHTYTIVYPTVTLN